MNSIETVNFELINKIRRHIQRDEKQVQLLTKQKQWMQLASSLDVLEDTSWAIEYYIKAKYPEDIGGRYLYTYGLLQALFVQSDAVNHMYVSLFKNKIDFKNDYPQAYYVREMRNDVVGHPTNRKDSFFIHLAQCSMSKSKFEYFKYASTLNTKEAIKVDLNFAIEEISKFINSLLIKSIKELDDEFKEYIETHKERKMQEIFNGLMYAKEKILENKDIKLYQYNKTKRMISNCEHELKLRYGSVSAIDSYSYLLHEIHEIYDLIDKKIKVRSEEPQDNSKYYLLQCLFYKFNELEECCKETDSYFENYGEETQKNMDLPQVVILNDL